MSAKTAGSSWRGCGWNRSQSGFAYAVAILTLEPIQSSCFELLFGLHRIPRVPSDVEGRSFSCHTRCINDPCNMYLLWSFRSGFPSLGTRGNTMQTKKQLWEGRSIFFRYFFNSKISMKSMRECCLSVHGIVWVGVCRWIEVSSQILSTQFWLWVL